MRRWLPVTVRIDEMTSEVTLEGEPRAEAPETGAPPAEDLHDRLERLARDAARTCAEGYGD
jgi:hypothetical protein